MLEKIIVNLITETYGKLLRMLCEVSFCPLKRICINSLVIVFFYVITVYLFINDKFVKPFHAQKGDKSC